MGIHTFSLHSRYNSKNRPVAVKIVKNRAGVNRTENEAQIVGWKHRNIVRIFKVESTINFGIIIMEHFPGQSLQLILDSVELSLSHRALIALDILAGLSYCHKQALLHLDVKPQNILIAFDKPGYQSTAGLIGNACNNKNNNLRRKYTCKLCDFGSSMKIGDQKQRKGHVGGTVRYMSPEALRSEVLSPAADIYSLGITMWQLKHRRAPYDAIQCNEVVAFQVVKNDLRPDSDLRRFLQMNFAATKLSPKVEGRRCDCEHFSTEISCLSKKNIRFGALDIMKLSPRGCFSAGKKDSSLGSSISPITRVSGARGHRYSQPHSAVRNLRKELDFMDDGTKSGVLPFNFLAVFQDVSVWEAKIRREKETAFCEIFQSCWHSAPEARPCIAQLYKQLKMLLK